MMGGEVGTCATDIFMTSNTRGKNVFPFPFLLTFLANECILWNLSICIDRWSDPYVKWNHDSFLRASLSLFFSYSKRVKLQVFMKIIYRRSRRFSLKTLKTRITVENYLFGTNSVSLVADHWTRRARSRGFSWFSSIRDLLQVDEMQMKLKTFFPPSLSLLA